MSSSQSLTYEDIGDEMVDLGEGVTCQWLDDGRVLAFALKDMRRTTVDVWLDGVDRACGTWPENQPMLLLHELPSLPITPYVRQRIGLTQQRAKENNYTGWVAMVAPGSVFTILIRLFTERDSPKVSSNFIRRAFTSREKGLEWLLKEGYSREGN